MKNLGEKIDRVGGKLYHRLVSIVPLIMGVGLGWMGIQMFSAGYLLGGFVLSALSLGLLWMVHWCWSGNRRLSDIDP